MDSLMGYAEQLINKALLLMDILRMENGLNGMKMDNKHH